MLFRSDFVICCGHWHQLQFTPEEIKMDKVDIMNHLHELTPNEGRQVGLVTVGNGIKTSLKECFEMSKEVGNTVGSTLLIALYNPTEGFIKDVKRTYKERAKVETPTVSLARQFMTTTADKLYKINPQVLWLCIPHSENGVITKRAIEGMTEGQQQILQEILHVCDPLPDRHAHRFGLDPSLFRQPAFRVGPCPWLSLTMTHYYNRLWGHRIPQAYYSPATSSKNSFRFLTKLAGSFN